jgi:pyrroloquinoline quinone (PQQ) biosynthesis protein C
VSSESARQQELDQFLAARKALLEHRTSWQAAVSAFRWPQLEHFNWARDYFDGIARGNPAGFLGMVLVLEGTSTAVALNAAEALKNSLQLPKKAFSYLTSHGALDQEHTRFYATLVNRLTEAEDRAAVVHGAKVFYRLYGDVFCGLDARRSCEAEALRKCA